MRLVLLAVLLASLAGCEYRYAAVATDKNVYVLDKKTGQVAPISGIMSRPPTYLNTYLPK